MDKLISFIIPAYNAENYLNTVCSSFLLKELDKSKVFQKRIEVIVVDDGSQDRTAEIAKTYIEQEPEVFRLLQKKNGGHGSAINAGTRIAIGKYLKIIDADDWVVTENLPEILQRLEHCEAEVVLNPFHKVDFKTRKKELQCVYGISDKVLYSLKDILAQWNAFKQCMTFHGIMYKRDFYEAYRHELPEQIFYEDQEYAAIPCCHAKIIQVIDLVLYQYLLGNSEQSVASSNQLKRISHIEQVVENLLHYEKKEELTVEGHQYLLKKLEGVCLSWYCVANLVNPNKKEGRVWSRAFNCRLKKEIPLFYKEIQKKYALYFLLNCLHVGMEKYEKMLHSGLYHVLSGNYKRRQKRED